jgi:hypothetical protein
LRSQVKATSENINLLRRHGINSRLVSYANGDKSVFVSPRKYNKKDKKINMARPTSYWPYETDADINDRKFISWSQANALEEQRYRNKLSQYSELKNNSYMNAKELRWVVIRKNTGDKDIVGIGLMPYGVAKAHLMSLGFDTNDSQNMKEWKKSESFGSLSSNPNDELLVQLHNELRMTPDTDNSYSIRMNMGLEFTISPPYDEIYNRISNDDMELEKEYGTDSKEINPFMGVKSEEKGRLISWLPELSLYLTNEDVERMVDFGFGKMSGRRRTSQFNTSKSITKNNKKMKLFPLDTGEFQYDDGALDNTRGEVIYDGINRQVNPTNSGQGKELYFASPASVKNSINQDDRFGNQRRRNTSRNIGFYEDFNNLARRNWRNSIPYYPPAVDEILREWGIEQLLPSDDAFVAYYNIDPNYPLDVFGDEILSDITRQRAKQTKSVVNALFRRGDEPVDYYINRWEGKEPSYQTYLGDRSSGN